VAEALAHEITSALDAFRDGDSAAAGRLLPLVYDQLRDLAGSYFRRQPAGHTLQPTALVHEAFVKLVEQTQISWTNREHFLAIAATAMRQILTDHARRVRADKRGGSWERVTLSERLEASSGAELDVVELDEALTRLAALDERKHRVVELRYFGGLTVEEVANLLGVSKRTVEKDWHAARAWLSVQLSGEGTA